MAKPSARACFVTLSSPPLSLPPLPCPLAPAPRFAAPPRSSPSPPLQPLLHPPHSHPLRRRCRRHSADFRPPPAPPRKFATMRLFGADPPLNERPHPDYSDDSPSNTDTATITQNGHTSSSSSAVAISAELRAAIQRMYVSHITDRGVDYDKLQHSAEFRRYVIATRSLPRLDVAAELQDDKDKIVFFINLYNALTQHGVIERGSPPQTTLGRLSWSMRTTYRVGKYNLSLHEMENGILRGNKRLSVLPAPFGLFDERKKLRVRDVDARIHFMLNCAANSCPPVLYVTRENMEYTLATATRGFLANESNFQVAFEKEDGSDDDHGDDDGNSGKNDGGKTCVVSLSLIFKWYRTDFAENGSDEGILQYVAQHGSETQENIVELKGVLSRSQQQRDSAGCGYRVEWLPYDWGLNSA